MKVKAITDYNDTKLNRLVKNGEELEVTDNRANILINAKVAMAIPTPTTEKVAKGRKKKEA